MVHVSSYLRVSISGTPRSTPRPPHAIIETSPPQRTDSGTTTPHPSPCQPSNDETLHSINSLDVWEYTTANRKYLFYNYCDSSTTVERLIAQIRVMRSSWQLIAAVALLSNQALCELYTPKHEAGRCSIRGNCGKKSLFGAELPCPDNGLAEEPTDEVRKHLVELCGPKWTSGPVCCKSEQVCAR